ncbi:hypothetical protein [Tenacibaculum sp. 190524A02b]|uniref:Uncharacterized protein n=1 Tax=Tenacibaculum vairaonense TaxID=3137860 RepID=A0ABP1FB29_9FLAO
MVYKLTTYKTLTGTKQILELQKKKRTEAIVYKGNQPAFFVDCFDLQTESNVKMNSLVLCQKRSIEEVIKDISKRNNIDLSVKEAPLFSIEKSYEYREVELPPLPENWLN